MCGQPPSTPARNGRWCASMPLRTRAALPLALLALAFPATASASITEFTGLTKGTPSGGITAGPDDAVWFTIKGSPGGIGHIHADGSITEHGADVVPGFTRDSDPADIVAGPDGALWFTEQAGRARSARFDPDTETVTEYCDRADARQRPHGHHRRSGREPLVHRAGERRHRPDHARGRDHRVHQRPLRLVASRPTSPPAPTATSGSRWRATRRHRPDRPGDRRDHPVQRRPRRPTARRPRSPPPPTASSTSRSRAWSRIGKITTGGTIYEFADGIAPGSRPAGIAEGGDGALWFTTAAALAPLGRLWPDSGAIQQLSGGLTGILEPGGITRGPDGNVWYTLAGCRGSVASPSRRRSRVGMPAAHDGKVKLKGDVTANSQATTYFFEYGRDGAFDTQTVVASAGDTADEVGVTRSSTSSAAPPTRCGSPPRTRPAPPSRARSRSTSPSTARSSRRSRRTRARRPSSIEQPPAAAPRRSSPPVVAVLPPAAPVLGESVNVAPVDRHRPRQGAGRRAASRRSPPARRSRSARSSTPARAAVELRSALRDGQDPDRHVLGRDLQGPPAPRRPRDDRPGAARRQLRGAAAAPAHAAAPSPRGRRGAPARSSAACGARTATPASAPTAATASPPCAAPSGRPSTAATAR